MEYQSHGHAVPTGRPYNNHYLSIIYIEDRRIVRWRDYWNPVEVLTALGGTITLPWHQPESGPGATMRRVQPRPAGADPAT